MADQSSAQAAAQAYRSNPQVVAASVAKDGAHPEYRSFEEQVPSFAEIKIRVPKILDVWELIADAVDGTGGFANGGYLVPHELEYVPGQGDWHRKFYERQLTAHYDNFVRSICDGPWNSIVGMRDSIVRKAEVHPNLEVFWDDVDGNGTSMNDFLAYPALQARRYNAGWILLDRAVMEPKSAAGKPSKLDASGGRTWAWAPPTRNVVWWEFDETGELDALAVKMPTGYEEHKDDRCPLLIWTKYTWTKWNPQGAEYVIDSTGPNGWGFVPAVQIFDQYPGPGKGLGSASMLTIARIAQTIYNMDSEVREIERHAAFPALGVPVRNMSDLKELAISTNGVLAFTGDSGMPAWIEPNLISIDKYAAERKALKDAAYAAAEMTGLIGHAETVRTQSGFHAEVEMDKSERCVGRFAASVEQAENKIARMWLSMNDEGDEGYEISYPRKYYMADKDKLITRAQNRLNLGLGNEDVLVTLNDYYSEMYPRKTQLEIDALSQAGAAELDAKAKATAAASAAAAMPADQNPVTARQRLGLVRRNSAA